MRKSKIICVLLAAAIFVSGSVMTGCGKKTADDTTAAETEKQIAPGLRGAVDAVIEDGGFDTSLVGGLIFKEDDTDEEMLQYVYWIVDTRANELIKDYVLTDPTDYNQSIVAFTFEDGMTEEDFAELKSILTENYISDRAKSLQMYMPDEYAVMKWALENPDLIWRQYDNALVLIIDGKGEATADFEAFESAAKTNGII